MNKAHRSPEEGGTAGTKKPAKKARRRTMSNANLPPNPLDPGTESGPERPSLTAEHRLSSDRLRRASIAGQTEASVSGSYSALQAQRMYPHHPLLADATLPIVQPRPQWNNMAFNTMQGMAGLSGVNPVNQMPFAGTMPMPMQMPQPISPTAQHRTDIGPPFTALPMRMTESDNGIGSSAAKPMQTSFELGYKKRACDHCNSSKVKCNGTDPCRESRELCNRHGIADEDPLSVRCVNRHLQCTYNKPSKVRGPQGHRLSFSGSFHSGNSTNSLSPESFVSSPHSVSSTVGSGMLPPAPPKPLTVTTPITANHMPLPQVTQSMPAVASNGMMWNGQVMQLPGQMWQSVPNLPTQMTNSNQMFPQQTATYASPSQIASVPQPQPSARPMYAHSTSVTSATSPQTYIAATPSLTSMTTSPSESDHLSERRASISQSNPMAYVDGQGQWNGALPNPGVNTPGMIMPTEVTTHSPVQMQAPKPTGAQPVRQYNANNWQWPTQLPVGALDPQNQFRNPLHNDDEDDGGLPVTAFPPGSAHSAHLELDPVLEQQMLQHRRRSSAGIWASAFNQMSLRDPSVDLSAMARDPFTASLIAQQQGSIPVAQAINTAGALGINPAAVPKRNATLPVQVEVQNSRPTPARTDSKDLWKLFMEPMNGTPGLDPSMAGFSQVQNAANPGIRPGMGERSLSKSNSMPDLQAMGNAMAGMKPEQLLGFAFQAQAQAQAQAAGQSVAPTSGQKSAVTPGGSPTSAIRPMASVLQQNAALQQTLAPERAPSFGLASFDALPTPNRMSFSAQPSSLGLHPPTPTALSYHFPQPSGRPSMGGSTGMEGMGQGGLKLPSSLSRPGAKRIASQVLEPPESAKVGKMGLDLWEGEENIAEMGTGSGSNGMTSVAG